MAGARRNIDAKPKPSPQQRVQQLTERMLGKKLYVVLSSAKRGADLMPHLAAHLEYMIKREKKRLLFASGPFTRAPGDGMTIFRTASLKWAHTIAARDPLVVNGLRTFDIREWTLNEGSLGLSLNLSDQIVEVA
jgi:uncharacterized protein